VFCRFDAEVRAPILTTPGVIRVVGGNMPIDQGEIEAIQAVVKHRVPAEPCAYLQIGTRVQVLTGPLAGVEGILLSFKNQHRLIISVTLVQNSISVEVEGENVTCVSRSKIQISPAGRAIAAAS